MNMKKILYGISAVLLVMTVACNKTFDEPKVDNFTTVPPAEGTLVKVSFEVSYPGSSATTKAVMGEYPKLDNLYMAIFSEDNGYLQNWIPTDFVQVTQAGVQTKAKYEVYLPITDNEVFHFIGNTPDEQPSFDYEEKFVKSMVTGATKPASGESTAPTTYDGAFWQRVVIPGGVKAKKVNGKYVLDDNGNYTVDYDSIKDLMHVVLVRNYAKIVVQSADPSEFTVVQYALGYYPTSGTVAPWNTKTTGEGDNVHTIGFDIPYTSIKNYLPQVEKEEGAIDYDTDLQRKGRFYEDLTMVDATGYTGYAGTMPEGVVFNSDEPTTFVQATSTVEGYDNGLYMYERTMPNETDQLPTVVLMQVNWTDGNSLGIPKNQKDWYKVELLDKDGEYLPLLRNIRYTLSLSGIKERGKSTSKAAWEASALGNISSSIETAALNDISDGSSRILVEKLDYAFFSNIGNTTLEFQFYPVESSNETVNKTDPAKNVVITVTKRLVDGYAEAVTNEVSESVVTIVEHEDGSVWGSIPLTIGNVPEEGELKSIIRVQGKYGSNRALYREVTYEVMGRQDFTDESKAEKGEGVTTDGLNRPVNVTIGLPSELTRDIFPLQVRIEALDNNLSATDPDLPVLDGLSTFPDKKAAGKRSFYYVKTIEYDDYCEYSTAINDYVYTTEFTCTLYTTKESGNNTTIRLSYNSDDESEWLFNPKDLTLTF